MDNWGAQDLARGFIRAYNSLEQNKEYVNSLNVFPVPDGDTGTNMALTLRSAIRQMEQTECKSVYDVAKAISNGALMGARGNSGVILSQIFRGFARGLNGKDTLDTESLVSGFVNASETAYKAVMRPTEGTMLTVMREMAEYAEKDGANFQDVHEFAKAVLQAGEVSLMQTPELLPILKEAGVVDAGGKGLLVMLQGALSEEDGDIPVDFQKAAEDFDAEVRAQQKVSGEITYGYCTELMILGKDIDIESLRTELGKEGDSHLVVGDETRVKIHLHTNHPGAVLERAAQLGSLTDIKIDNMREQYAALTKTHANDLQTEETENQEPLPYGFISVSTGEGIQSIFRDLGVNRIINGGQTMNPSTEDILQAIQAIPADTIYILPNNSNIFMASNQAAKLSKKDVLVIPTRTIPEGFAAMMHFDAEKSPQDNEKQMTEALKDVRTAEITYAVRDTSILGKKIHKGSFIGIEGDEIHASGKHIKNVVMQLLEKTITKESSLITMLSGEDTTEKDAKKMLEAVRKKYPDIDVELAHGGQPLYFYIFSIE